MPSSPIWRWNGKISASTQNQALAALLFLYRELLKQDLDCQRRELTVASFLLSGRR